MRAKHRRKCAHTNAFDVIFSVVFFFLYVVLCWLHVEWDFDSGEFVLKLNASLNNSLVQVLLALVVWFFKTHIRREQKKKKVVSNRKKRSEKKFVCIFTSVTWIVYWVRWFFLFVTSSFSHSIEIFGSAFKFLKKKQNIFLFSSSL